MFSSQILHRAEISFVGRQTEMEEALLTALVMPVSLSAAHGLLPLQGALFKHWQSKPPICTIDTCPTAARRRCVHLSPTEPTPAAVTTESTAAAVIPQSHCVDMQHEISLYLFALPSKSRQCVYVFDILSYF